MDARHKKPYKNTQYKTDSQQKILSNWQYIETILHIVLQRHGIRLMEARTKPLGASKSEFHQTELCFGLRKRKKNTVKKMFDNVNEF